MKLMLTSPQPALMMYQIHHLEVLISLLMNSIRYMPFPLGIHLLRGRANPPDLSLGHNPKILCLPILLGGMMAPSSCLLKSIGYWVRMHCKPSKPITLRLSVDSTRGKSTILKLWKSPRMTLLGPQYLKLTFLTSLKVT